MLIIYFQLSLNMDFYKLFIKPYESYEPWQIWLEAIATAFGLASVYFSIKKNIWVYPTGIVSTIIYVYLLFAAGLLGDTIINVYYTVMSLYGWVLWAKNSNDQVHIQPEWATKSEWIKGLGLFVLSIILVTVVYYFKPFIDNHFNMSGVELGLSHLDWANWLDVFTTSIFLVGMWFMAKRKIENWLFWIVGDLICIPMMIYKGLGITSIQFLFFTAMAVIGYLEWRKTMSAKYT